MFTCKNKPSVFLRLLIINSLYSPSHRKVVNINTSALYDPRRKELPYRTLEEGVNLHNCVLYVYAAICLKISTLFQITYYVFQQLLAKKMLKPDCVAEIQSMLFKIA